MAAVALPKIEEQIGIIRNYADDAINSARDALSNLTEAEYDYSTDLSSISVLGADPYPLVEPSPVSPIAIDSAPDIVSISIPVAPIRPDITIPTAPVQATITVPASPSISTPTMGTVTLGSLLSPVIPSAPVIDIDSLSISEPENISVTPISWSFSVSDVLISDDPLIATMITRLADNIVNGGTGLSSTVEDAIFNRDLERNEQQLEDALDKARTAWSKTGFTLPDGMLANSLSSIQKEYMNRLIDRSREIAIKQADLEQSNLFKSIELAVNLAFKLVDANTKYEELVLKSLELTAQYANEYIRLQIEAHRSAVEVFKAKIQIFEATIRAQLAKAEVYRSQIQAVLATVAINEQTVKVYAAQIDAEIAQYKGKIEANQSIIQMFSEEIRAVLAQSQVEESKVKAYAESVRALIATAEIYKSQVEGMTAELGIEKAKVEANIAQITAWSKIADSKIATFTAGIEQYKAEAQFNVSSAEVNNKSQESSIGSAIEMAKVNVALAELQSKALIAEGSVRVEAAKGVAAATASMAAGAMAAMSARASMSYSETAEA